MKKTKTKNSRPLLTVATLLLCSVLFSSCGNIPSKDGSVWKIVNTPGFGNANNFSVVAMTEYNGKLYALTRNQAQGGEVWRYDGTTWEQVLFPGGITNGVYGNPRINNVWARMAVFKGKLYFGFSSGLQGSFLGSTGCEIWRFDGQTWEPVISDLKDVDEAGTITSITGCSEGDGETTARFTDASKSWQNDMWVGGFLQITSGEGKYRKFRIVGNTVDTLIVQQNEAAGTYNAEGNETEYTVCSEKNYNNPFPAYSYTLGSVKVGDSYEIGIGDDESGFGEVWNKTITAMVIFDDKLYVSTGLNYEYGGQVWYTENGDDWTVTQSALPVPPPYCYSSFGNYHSSSAYPGGLKPVSSSVTDLVVSSISGTPILYAGGTGTSGDRGGCSRMAKLTDTGWELIVDSAIDENTTGTNENGFGSSPTCGTNQENFMPWDLEVFNNKLFVGVTGEGARVLYTDTGSSEDGAWHYSVGGTSAYPNGFDGYRYSDGNYQNLSVNLFAFGNTMYAGIVTQYIPEYTIPPDKAELKGSQLWRTRDGVTWTQVTDNGFGDADIIIFEAFATYNGKLYVSGSKGASSTPSGLGGAKIFCMMKPPEE
ncbi:MAG: hypothetical protein N3B18_12475 [Desulfobacterota bacterium]|nr:hypothetical protein [Thermodesulfobacteriota bacterium]